MSFCVGSDRQLHGRQFHGPDLDALTGPVNFKLDHYLAAGYLAFSFEIEYLPGMTIAFQVNTDELDASFVEWVKVAFPQKLIGIVVSEADETSTLLSDPARRERLLRAAVDVEAGRNIVAPDQSQFR